MTMKKTMYPYGTYHKYDNSHVFGGTLDKNKSVWTTSNKYEKVYSYEEAIELAGNGRYNLGLLAVTSISFMAMTIDMFSFSTVVALSRCDLQLDFQQTTILMSIPFIGPISMAYAWGYISDTQGRRHSLMVGMTCSCVMAVLCAFAPDWITLGVFKLIGTCFCSCAQSATYALLGESCPATARGTLMLILSSVVQLSVAIYFALAYLIGLLDFSLDIAIVTFVPWRLLALILAIPLGISAVSLLFFYESPKFLLNTEKKEEALDILKKISQRNGVKGYEHKVKNLSLFTKIETNKEMYFVQSLWAQTAPLFKPPLLRNTLILYYFTFVLYSTAPAIFMWLPFLSESFTKVMIDMDHDNRGICSVISGINVTTTNNGASCSSSVGLPVVTITIILGIIFCILNLVLARLSTRKKTVSIITFLICALFSAGALVFKNNLVNIIMLCGILTVSLIMGIIFSYFVDLVPTTYLGMASCLNVMVSRTSSVIGINVMGALMMTNCTTVFILWTFNMLIAAIVCCFLPADTANTTKQSMDHISPKRKKMDRKLSGIWISSL